MRRIRTVVLNEKQQPRERWFTLAALSGDLTALKRQYGNDIEVADPSLTAAEIDKLKANFSYLKPFELPNVDALGEQEVVTEALERLTEKEDDTIEEKPHPIKRGRKPKQ